MKFEIVSVKLGKNPNRVVKRYPNIKGYEISYNKHNENKPLEVNVFSLEELMRLIKDIGQPVFVCHEDNTIHIYDEKLR